MARAAAPNAQATPATAVASQEASQQAQPASPTPAPSPVASETPTSTPAPPSHALVIAQGLVIPPAEPAVWRVREINPPPADEAQSESGGFSFTLQVEGVSVIRNDITNKRARLEPGEAYFMSADDPYTRRAEGERTSRAWVFEVVPPDTSTEGLEGTVIYTSETIDTWPQDVRDLEMSRNILFPGESAVLPSHTAPVLVMVLNGRIDVAPPGGASPTALQTGQGIVADDLNLTNTGDNAASYVAVALGQRVPDQSEAPPATEETPEAEASPTAAVALDPAADQDSDGLTNGDEQQRGTDPNKADTDGDSLSDADEVNTYDTDPLKADTDADNMRDDAEIDYTDPNNADTDGDGTSDGDEVFIYGTDPNNADDHP
jgi:Bacterial TSP3 repeat